MDFNLKSLAWGRFAILLVTGLFITSGIFAQQEEKIRFLNQYEAPIQKISITYQGKTIDYTTDKEGYATLLVNSNDSITISGAGHDTKTFKVADLQDKKVVVLDKSFSWKDLLTPMFYIINGGLWLLLFIVFAETGLFAGFFLPGDSLLFVAGIYSSNLANEFFKLFGLDSSGEWGNLFVLAILITLAGILGNATGYLFGRKIGPSMYHWKDNILFKQRYLKQAHDFYEKHGGGAIIIARFLPIIRTFAPIVAGIVDMNRKRFMVFNVIGCIAWVFSMIFAGHFLQKWMLTQFEFDLKKHLEIIVIGIVVITTAPVIAKLVFGGKKKEGVVEGK